MNETLMMSKKETLKCLVQQSTSSNIYKSGISTFKTEMAAEEQALIEKDQFYSPSKTYIVWRRRASKSLLYANMAQN